MILRTSKSYLPTNFNTEQKLFKVKFYIWQNVILKTRKTLLDEIYCRSLALCRNV
ncbi:unnamed protein product, partial [Bubo scandiacus]